MGGWPASLDSVSLRFISGSGIDQISFECIYFVIIYKGFIFIWMINLFLFIYMLIFKFDLILRIL